MEKKRERQRSEGESNAMVETKEKRTGRTGGEMRTKEGRGNRGREAGRIAREKGDR